MPTTESYLTDLVNQKKAFVDSLNNCEISASYDEKLNTLVPKINSIISIFDYNGARTSFNKIFYCCYDFRKLPKLNTANATDLSMMYYSCSNLETIPLINTSNATDISNMFYNCRKLQNIPLLDTSKVINMSSAFRECHVITTIPAIDTSNVIVFSNTFTNCYALTTIEQLNFSKCTTFTGMFNRCSALKNITITENSIVNNGLYFSDCTALTHDSLLSIIGALYDYSGGTSHSITLGSTNLNKLTTAEKAIATSRNWTLA